MSRTRDLFGIDGKDITIHVGLTAVVAIVAGGAGGEFQYDGDAVAMIILAASTALLGLRMFLGRMDRPAPPAARSQEALQELEERLHELEEERARLHELEERVDFAERLLVSEREKRARIEDTR